MEGFLGLPAKLQRGGVVFVFMRLLYSNSAGITIMYQPQFTITNKILKNIGVIEASKEVIENSPLVPAWEAVSRRCSAQSITARTLKEMISRLMRQKRCWLDIK